MGRAIDMTGKLFSDLVGVKPIGLMKNRNVIWQFTCKCGSSCEIDGYSVRSGKTTSCQSCAAERTRLASVKHGLSDTREFSTWTDIQSRCYNSNANGFDDYGGRGIKVCDRWLESFSNFLSDMGPRPVGDYSIERGNNDGNYEPGNCRWATRVEQGSNKRNNIKVEIDGITKTISEWARIYGVNVSTAWLRHKNGLRGTSLFVTTKKQISHNGITDTFAGWSKRTGINASTIAMRLHYGWTIEKTLTKGSKS